MLVVPRMRIFALARIALGAGFLPVAAFPAIVIAEHALARWVWIAWITAAHIPIVVHFGHGITRSGTRCETREPTGFGSLKVLRHIDVPSPSAGMVGVVGRDPFA